MDLHRRKLKQILIYYTEELGFRCWGKPSSPEDKYM